MKPNENMSFSLAGLRKLKNLEGFRSKPYDDLNSRDKNGKPIDWHPGMKLKGKLTIGYGRVLWDSLKGYEKYKNGITEAQATQMLLEDLRRFENAVRLNVLIPLKQHEFDAIVIFIFNIGLGDVKKGIPGFLTSTFLKFLNQGKKLDAANQMLRWVHSGGKLIMGLVNRRQAERTIFLEGKYT